MREALAVLLPAETGSALEQTARLLGVGRATVPRLRARFLARDTNAPQPRPRRGGRRRALMSKPEEAAFLKPWEEQARGGGVLVLSPIRAALSQKLGRPVARSVVYRLLERHGWRKVAPDTRHPKSDPAVQEDWKKTPGSSGGSPETGRGPRPERPCRFPRRGAFRTDGADTALLVSGTVSPRGVQRDSMDGVLAQLNAGLPRLAANTDGLRSLTAWP